MAQNRPNKSCLLYPFLISSILFFLSIYPLANQITKYDVSVSSTSSSSPSIFVDAFVISDCTTNNPQQPNHYRQHRHFQRAPYRPTIQSKAKLALNRHVVPDRTASNAIYTSCRTRANNRGRRRRIIISSNAGSTDSSDPSADEFSSFYEDTVYPLLKRLDEALNTGTSSSSSSSDQSSSPSQEFQLDYYGLTANRNNNQITNGYREPNAAAGLSKFHQRMLSPLQQRQRFITGRYPLHVSVQNNPTRKWLRQVSSQDKGTSQVFVNSTIVDQSLASYDRLQWLDSAERKALAESEGGYSMMTMELIAEINVKKPGYVNLLPSRGAGLSAAMRQSVFDGTGSGIPWGVWKDLEALGVTNSENDGDNYGDVDRLWITGFSLSKPKGELHYLDVDTCIMGTVDDRTSGSLRWPNEVNSVPNQWHSNSLQFADDDADNNDHDDNIAKKKNPSHQKLDDALLVTDGFLVPGKDKGGLYIVRNPGNKDLEWTVSLTEGSSATDRAMGGTKERDGADNWFYHRAVWVDLTGDGRQSILTARAKRPSILKSSGGDTSSQNDVQSKQTDGQLVWLERPKPHTYNETTGTPLDEDGSVFDPFSTRHTPWKVRVLEVGPDVMFSVADLDTTDNSIEVIASEFFGRKVSLHSIQRGPEPKITFRRTLDDQCGAAFSSILADLDVGNASSSGKHMVIDSGSTIETLKAGDSFSHLLVTSHENASAESNNGNSQDEKASTTVKSMPSDGYSSVNGAETSAADLEVGDNTNTTTFSPTSASAAEPNIDGGSLFAYRVPSRTIDAWKTDPWTRSVIATGFRVKGQLGNMINPGAPGFCYTFYPTKDGPLVNNDGSRSRPLIGISGDCAEAAYILRPIDGDRDLDTIYPDESTRYSLMCEIDCGATVGSLGISYDDFSVAEQQSGYAKIYIPCFEKDKVLVFAMGSVDNNDDDDDDDGW